MDSLFSYITNNFQTYIIENKFEDKVGGIRYTKDENVESLTRIIHFDYRLGQRSNIGSLPFQLVAKKEKDEETFSFQVVCNGGPDVIRETVTFIRMLIISWSATRNH